MKTFADTLVMGLLAISLGLWIDVFRFRRRHEWPLPWRARLAVPFQPEVALFAVVVVLIVSPILVREIWIALTSNPLLRENSEHDSLVRLQINGVAQLLSLLLIPTLLTIWYGFRADNFGLQPRNWRQDWQYGLWGVCLSQLPVRLVEFPIQNLRAQSPHPLLEILESPELSRITLFWIALQAILFAPLLEELLFRVVLQGVLERSSKPVWAVLISSMAFVATHNPVDWLPLFPLALILGYVYYRTHSYLAVFLLHASFNAISLCIALMTLTPRIAPLDTL